MDIDTRSRLSRSETAKASHDHQSHSRKPAALVWLQVLAVPPPPSPLGSLCSLLAALTCLCHGCFIWTCTSYLDAQDLDLAWKNRLIATDTTHILPCLLNMHIRNHHCYPRNTDSMKEVIHRIAELTKSQQMWRKPPFRWHQARTEGWHPKSSFKEKAGKEVNIILGDHGRVH